MIPQRLPLVLVALAMISVSGCTDSDDEPSISTSSSDTSTGPVATGNSTTMSLPPVANNETIRHFEETYTKILSQTRRLDGGAENTPLSNNCVFIRTEKPLQILRGQARAEWEPESPLTEILVAKLSHIPEFSIVVSDPQPSPLIHSFESLAPLEGENAQVIVWLELAGPGAALNQAFTMTLSFDYVSEAPPQVSADGNCA